MIYYGTEQGYSGGKDPDNRESLWPNFDVNNDIYKVLKTYFIKSWLKYDFNLKNSKFVKLKCILADLLFSGISLTFWDDINF